MRSTIEPCCRRSRPSRIGQVMCDPARRSTCGRGSPGGLPGTLRRASAGSSLVIAGYTCVGRPLQRGKDALSYGRPSIERGARTGGVFEGLVHSC